MKFSKKEVEAAVEAGFVTRSAVRMTTFGWSALAHRRAEELVAAIEAVRLGMKPIYRASPFGKMEDLCHEESSFHHVEV